MNADARVYALYGLRVHSEIPLPAPIAPSDLPPYDLQVCWGERKIISDNLPAGTIVSQLLLENGNGYTLVNTGNGYALSFHRTSEVWIDPALQTARVHLAANVHPGIAGLLVIGNVIAIVLDLHGESVLHASAVAMNGNALAFLGQSGMGKSSLAALCCANGARFVTDDLLRVQSDATGWQCFPGTGQLRLRKDAAILAENVPLTAMETTPDDRLALKLNDDFSMPRLQAIVIPQLSRTCNEVRLERIQQSKALVYLMAFARMQELRDRENRQRRLDFLGRIAARVPLFVAEIPWGLPLHHDVASALMREVGIML